MSSEEIKNKNTLPLPVESDQEEWRHLDEYPKYYVSSFGRLRTPAGNISDSKVDRTGSVRPHLVDKTGRRTKICMHMLVATAFLKDPGDGCRPFHRDGDKSNNHLSNIAWLPSSKFRGAYMKSEPEEWKGIYPGYQISSLGRLRLPNGNFSKAKPGPDGIIRVVLVNWEEKVERMPIQDLVAEAFLPRVEGKTHVNNKDGVKSNNRVTNLEWVSPLPVLDKPIEKSTEEWRTLDRYPRYQISSYGRVKCLNGYICKPAPNDEGYIRHILISTDGKKENKGAHWLTATAFIPNPQGKKHANHINGVRSDNRISNLEWCTIKENSSTLKKVFAVANIAGRPIVQYNLDGSPVKLWNKGIDIERELKISRTLVQRCCKGLCDNYEGFIWRYYDEVIDLPGEEWKWAVDGDIKLYVSSHGRVQTKSRRRTFGTKNDQGYMLYSKIRIHRLVCIAFKPMEGYESLIVDHIDGERDNNHIDNLEWVTAEENSRRARECTVFKETSHKRPVACYTLDDVFVKRYPSLKEAGEALGVWSATISQACMRGYTTTGYKWKYAD